LGFQVWIGDAAEIKRLRVRKQKTTAKMPDLCGSYCWKIAFREFGYRVLRIVICGNCCGIGIGWWQMRTRIMNQLQAVAMNEGYRWKKKLFSEKGRALLENSRWLPGPVGAGKNYWRYWISWIQRLRS